MSKKLINELAMALGHEVQDPQLSDLVAIAGKTQRDLSEACRLLKTVMYYSRDSKLKNDAVTFFETNPRLRS